jgi:hypothetical protein
MKRIARLERPHQTRKFDVVEHTWLTWGSRRCCLITLAGNVYMCPELMAFALAKDGSSCKTCRAPMAIFLLPNLSGSVFPNVSTICKAQKNEWLNTVYCCLAISYTASAQEIFIRCAFPLCKHANCALDFRQSNFNVSHARTWCV